MARDPPNASTIIEVENGHLQPRPLPERRRSRLWTIFMRILVAVLPFGAAAAGITLPIYMLFAWNTGDGSFDQTLCGIDYTSGAALITPDMTFGNFTITEARTIHISWNLIVGRGLQGIFGFILYRVGCGALLRIAERVPISLELFKTITLHPLSLSSIIPLARGFTRTSGSRARITLVFLLFSMIFLIALPTLSDIATGYLQNENAYAPYPNGTLFELSERWADYRCQYTSLPTFYLCPNVSAVPIQGKCVPQRGYQWGFSTFWVIILLFINFVWAFGMYGIWVDANRHSIQQNRGRTLGTWRAIVDLGGAIGHELGPNLSTYSDAELTRNLDKAKPVMYTVQQDTERGFDQIILSSDFSMQSRE